MTTQGTRTNPSLEVVIGALVVAGAFALTVQQTAADGYLDLRVWQEATADWWAGESPYDGRTYLDGLTFNYPPSALVLLAPLALVPPSIAGAALVAVGMLVLARVCRLALPRLGTSRLLLLVAALTLSEPAFATFALGQLGFVLLALTVASTLPVDGARTGPLLGLGAALKLYPAAALALVPRARFVRSSLTTLAVVVALGAVAALRVPGVLSDWWDQVRSGVVVVRPEDEVRNQSWRGLLESVLGEGTASRVLWLVVVATVLVVGAAVVRTSRRANDRLAALSAVYLVVVLVSPLVWTHYWVFLPLLLGTVDWQRTNRTGRVHRALVLALMIVAQVFAIWIPTSIGPDAVSGGGWILTYAYVLLGTAVLISLRFRGTPGAVPAPPPEDRSP